jgi:hypothetical protein
VTGLLFGLAWPYHSGGTLPDRIERDGPPRGV